MSTSARFAFVLFMSAFILAIADESVPAAVEPPHKVLRSTSEPPDSEEPPWWWTYMMRCANHWDDLPSQPFKVVVAGIGFFNLPTGFLVHYLGRYLGFPLYLEGLVGHHVAGARNFSTIYNEL